VTSQSPTDEEATEEYEQAWSSIQELTRTQGVSWSGGEQNHLFLNAGDGSFSDVSAVSHTDFADDGRAVISTDWDGDGRLDLLVRARTAPRFRLMLNQADVGSYLAVRLEGRKSNRDAIGARVFVKAGGQDFRRTLQAGDSFLAQSGKTLHFGLGDAEEVEEIRVHWPNGEVQTWTELHVNQAYQLVEGESQATELASADASLAAAPSADVPRTGKPVVRIPLIEKIPLHALPIPSFIDPNRTVASLGPGPVLINLWGVSCVNCLKEFGAFQRRSDQLAARGLRIVTLNTDPPESRARALEMLERFGLSEHAGLADERMLSALEAILYEVLGAAPGSPLPTSLLLDAQGQLCVVYQGKITMGELLRDAAIVATLQPQDSSAHPLFFGERLMKRHRNWRFLAKAFASYGLAELARDYGKRADALGQ
jgi:peroxiredoxin